MILAAALVAMGRQLAARHGHNGTGGALDDLQVADHEAVVEGNRAKGLETFSRLFHELDANLGDLHRSNPLGHRPEGRARLDRVSNARSPSRRGGSGWPGERNRGWDKAPRLP